MGESIELPVLGLPVRFTSRSADLLDAVEATFGAWRSCPTARPGDYPVRASPGAGHPSAPSRHQPFRVELVLRAGDEGGSRPSLRHAFLPGGRVVFDTPGSVALSDPVRGEAHALVTPTLAADGPWFRKAIVEAMVLSLLTAFDRTPLHAAGVVRDGTALVLAGPSGAGKSSLAWAARRAGYRLLSEDTLFLQSRPTLRVWGLPGPLYLPPGARDHFPELEDVPVTLTPAGKEKILLEPADLHEGAWASPPLADRAILCILGSGEGGPAAQAIDPETAVTELTGRLDPGFDRFRAVLPGLVRRLAEGGSWRLTRGPHPRDLIPTLQTILERTQR